MHRTEGVRLSEKSLSFCKEVTDAQCFLFYVNYISLLNLFIN